MLFAMVFKSYALKVICPAIMDAYSELSSSLFIRTLALSLFQSRLFIAAVRVSEDIVIYLAIAVS